VCINTGGEKVFPEEVEERLKTHPAVRDAVCVGIPDERFGEIVCAVVEPASQDEPPSLGDLVDHLGASLASFKFPRRLVILETIGRAPNGKVDYQQLKQVAVEPPEGGGWRREPADLRRGRCGRACGRP
jgi:3-oxocholest-4-en-26-oate---CoA ligase